MSDLSLISTQTMLTELTHRYENMIFYATYPKDSENSGAIYRYCGDVHSCIGACERLSYILMQELDSTTVEEIS